MKKTKILLLAMSISLVGYSQTWDDDIYGSSLPPKSVKQTVNRKYNDATKTSTTNNVYIKNGQNNVDIISQGNVKFDVDAYNRRGNVNIYTNDANTDSNYETDPFYSNGNDYEYTDRIVRFHNPENSVKIVSDNDINVYVVDDVYNNYYSNRGWNLNVNLGFGWGSPWYGGGWYYPTYYTAWYSPWYGGWGWNYPYYGGWYSSWYGGWGWNYPYYGGWGYPRHYGTYNPYGRSSGGRYSSYNNNGRSSNNSSGRYSSSSGRVSNGGRESGRYSSGRISEVRNTNNTVNRSSSGRYSNYPSRGNTRPSSVDNTNTSSRISGRTTVNRQATYDANTGRISNRGEARSSSGTSTSGRFSGSHTTPSKTEKESTTYSRPTDSQRSSSGYNTGRSSSRQSSPSYNSGRSSSPSYNTRTSGSGRSSGGFSGGRSSGGSGRR